MKLFELFATLSLDTNDFDSEINNATSKGKTLGTELERIVARGTAAGTAMYNFARSAATSMFNAGRDLVETAAEVQAENAAFEATFGDLKDAANQAFSDIGKDTNIVATRLRTVGTKAFAQFKGAGIDAAESMEMMDKYMRLAADGAAYYDMSLSEVDYRMRSFLRGNVEAGDQIGLYTSELQRNEKALDLYGQKWNKLNEAQRQNVMLSIVEEIYKQGNVTGQAAREMSNYQNVLGNLQETWRQIKAKLGGPILEAMVPAIEKFAKFLEENPEIVEALAETIGEIANMTFGALQGLLEFVANNRSVIVGTFQGIADALNSIAWLFGFGGTGATGSAKEIEDYNNLVADYNKFFPDMAMTPYEEWMGWDPSMGSLMDFMMNPPSKSSNATGLPYVPYDGFLSVLHKGEEVLNARDAEAHRNGMGQTQGLNYRLLAMELAYAMDGVAVQMDGQTVGRLVAPAVSREIRRETQSKRYTT